jgi:hypothetical protein
VILRGARYHAAVQVSSAIVPPLARPDPWRESFAAPLASGEHTASP